MPIVGRPDSDDARPAMLGGILRKAESHLEHTKLSKSTITQSVEARPIKDMSPTADLRSGCTDVETTSEEVRGSVTSMGEGHV